MTWLRSWLTGVFAAAMVTYILRAVTPKGVWEKLLRILSGVVLAVMMLSPLLQMDFRRIEDYFPETESDLQEKLDTYRKSMLVQESEIIGDKTAAYITQTASTMGITCTAEVQCVLKDGVPYPSEVHLNIPYRRELSDRIAEELAIPAEKQHWVGE